MIKEGWAGNLIVEEGKDSLRLTVTSNSSDSQSAYLDIPKEEVKEFISGLFKLTYGTSNILPSAHQVGDTVYFCLPGVPQMHAWVTSVRFYQGKVKYDLEVTLLDKSITRKYNIDSTFVTKYTSPEKINLEI